MSAIITLTTDFGIADPWVGVMKGAILSVDPSAVIVDITHEIPPQDVFTAARAVGMIGDSFPPGTVHVVVVDPGVGSNREAVVIRTARYFFVGPNNGVFSLVDGPVKAVKIQNPEFLAKKISVTFHGRDVFAPVAAHLGRRPVEDFGPEITDLKRLPFPQPARDAKSVTGEITHFDRFGNAFTNIPGDMVIALGADSGADGLTVEAGGITVRGVSYYYQSTPAGKLGAIINGFGLLELFAPNASAQKDFGLKTGGRVTVAPVRK